VSLAVQIPRARGQQIRILLDRAGAVERGVRIHEAGDYVQIPLSRELSRDERAIVAKCGGSLVELAEAVPRTVRTAPYENILRALKIPEAAKALLPEKWELLGDVLILKLDESLDDWLEPISSAYAEELGARTVLREVASISGQYREPSMVRLWGDGTETVHLENGIKYGLDAAKLMFSSGNVDERHRMATISKPGETVVDMFAGIGYFTLPLAKYSKPARVVAFEINPLSHSYLVKNVSLNELDNVEPRLGDCAGAEDYVADRVLMGYVGTTHLYLRKAMRILRGPGFIHYHETCPNALLPDRPTGRVLDAAKAEGVKAEVVRFREVKSYAPGVSHVVLDVFVAP
jgi:tRNA wybutosine-synthesizing protein 2